MIAALLILTLGASPVTSTSSVAEAREVPYINLRSAPCIEIVRHYRNLRPSEEGAFVEQFVRTKRDDAAEIWLALRSNEAPAIACAKSDPGEVFQAVPISSTSSPSLVAPPVGRYDELIAQGSRRHAIGASLAVTGVVFLVGSVVGAIALKETGSHDVPISVLVPGGVGVLLGGIGITVFISGDGRYELAARVPR